MKEAELKAFLAGKGIEVDDCPDINSLIDRAAATEEAWSAKSAAAPGPAAAPPAPAPTPLPAKVAAVPRKLSDLASMRTRQLKAFLRSKSVYVDDCFDMETLMARAEETQAQWSVPAAAPVAAPPVPPPPAAPARTPVTASPTPTAEEVEEAWRRVCSAWPGEDPLETGPGDADKCAILLHGFGDAGGRYMSDTMSVLLRTSGLRLLLPQAPEQELQGQRLQSWFLPTNGQWIVDDVVAEPVVKYLHAMVRRELARGVPANRIMLGGFAQGASCAVRAALSFPDAPLGGAVALSPFFGSPSAVVAPANRGLKVLVCHGKDDDVVPFSEGERAASVLRGLVRDSDAVSFKKYDMKHGVATDELADVITFLEERMAAEVAAEAEDPVEALPFDPIGATDPAKKAPAPSPPAPPVVPGFDPKMDPSVVLELLHDDEVAAAARDPEGMAVVQDVIMDPAMLERHRSNPRVAKLVERIESKMSN